MKANSKFSAKTANKPLEGPASTFTSEKRSESSYTVEISKRDTVRNRLKKSLDRDIKKNKHLRNSQRKNTFIASEMTFPGKNEIAIVGAITDFSEGGLTFKPLANYLEYRENENVEINFNGHKKYGVIRSSRPDGYGVQVMEKFSVDEINTINKVWAETRYHLGELEKTL